MAAKEIMFHPHFVKRWKTRDIDLGRVEDTARTGKIFERTGEKRGFKKYYGKENETYIVIAMIEEDFIEVRTAWKTKGR